MKKSIIILLTIFNCLTSFCQTITERLILTDTKDSLLINAEQRSFAEDGSYCFEVKEGKKEFFLTNKEKIGGFKFIGATYGNGGAISYTNSYSSPKDEPWYYRNSRSTRVFGPIVGKLEKYMTSGTKGNIAISTSYGDTISFYVNGELVSRNLKTDLHQFDIDHYEWCAFSENGNSIYYFKKDSLYHLFVNGISIDKSVNSFGELHINNNGDYVYAEGRRPKVKTNGYDYMFFVHTKDTIIGPVRTVWNNSLGENNAYYFSGDDNGTDYIIVNNSMQKGIENVADVILLSKENYFYSFTVDENSKINVNGEVYSFPLSEIILPSISRNGDFAFYGLKDYYLYKFNNGKQVENPITKYGVRPQPIYINPKGESIHAFLTDDSIYLYQDDKLLFKPIGRKTNFTVRDHDELFSNLYKNGKSGNGNSLLYLEYDNFGYWLFNGSFSKPMIRANGNSSSRKNKGEIAAGELNDYGFFLIQRIGKSKFQININNKVYKELVGVDLIFEDNSFFDDKELTFFGIKGLSIYQFKIAF